MNTWVNQLNANPIDWLLASNPWTRYRTYTDLLGFTASNQEAVEAKAEWVRDPNILTLAQETKDGLPNFKTAFWITNESTTYPPPP
jgi:hypothetical protein